jgi:hypothetical protein
VAATYAFRGELWRYPGESSWHFITLPVDLAEEVREDAVAVRKAFGSVKVRASTAGERWRTSLFWDSTSGSYLLPLKKSVRTAAGIRAGDEVDVALALELGPGPN